MINFLLPSLRLLRRLLLIFPIGLFTSTLSAFEVQPVPEKFIPSQDNTPILMLDIHGESNYISRTDIELLPLYSISLYHFKGIHGVFTGAWLKDLLSDQNIDKAATLRFIAHDDYSVFITSEDRHKRDYLLVTRLDGEPLTLNDFGPTLLIVPAEAEAVQAGATDMTHWVWSIRDIFIQ
ncbi:hypothetical protein P8S55_11035 [Halomonas sp. M1]|uniref:hypothetical protein n=1 Tax=Halomonas sp. M1 TaxID=3035470 RepID=UPI002485314F|nr:hypothetical protein [Halomonas sp. M1]WFE70323.1 hypothetical protein P8S55_11035 [Halomonas sp. M1]